MARPFEVRTEIETEATPEQAWDAITTGPGMDGWFMGRNEVEPRMGGAARTTIPGFTMESTVTGWDRPRRFVIESARAEDGRSMAFEYLIEGRGGKTVVRLVHSGFLPDDDWEQEFEALKIGDPAYLQKLGQYLKYFRGRTATPISAYGPQVERDRAWTVFKKALGLTGDAVEGTRVQSSLEGLPPIDGVVDYVSPDFLGVRTSDALYRFIHGLGGTVVLGHHIFSNVDQKATEQAWQTWVNQAFA
jgi:uncharacterized protein YndB with AHSA1/START domain